MRQLTEAVIREMSLRDPQADALRRFSVLIEPVDLHRMDRDRVKLLLEAGGLYSDTPYARLTFALATGVGKTRLMGAMIALLFRAQKAQHFVILSPSSTIYDKIKREAQPGHPKYLFVGTNLPPPTVVHDRNWTSFHPDQIKWLGGGPVLFLLTPGLILRSRGGASERLMRQPNEIFGGSFVEYLSQLPDLVVFLDEAHRFQQGAREEHAWGQAVGDLNPKLVIEMTATPRSRRSVAYCYDLKTALRDGRYVKNVACLYRERPVHLQGPEHDLEWDIYTLTEAIRLLERKQAACDALAAEAGLTPVKPTLLVSCRDIEHAAQIEAYLTSGACRNGRFQGRVLRVDSSRSEEEWLPQLLEVERPDNPTQIIVNVGMLKEGWDVSNVYVIAPLRAMAAEILTVQTIGRGLRLPYGRRVGEREADTLHVLAFGRETVREVIERAQQIGVEVETDEDNERYPRTVVPREKFTISIPLVGVRTPRPDLGIFSPEVRVRVDDEANARSLREIEVPTGRVTEVAGEAILADIPRPARALAILLCRKVPELGGQEAEAERVFIEYFRAVGATEPHEQNRLLQLRGNEVFEDVLNQVSRFLGSLSPRYESEGTMVEFRFGEVTYQIRGVIDKDAAHLPRHRDYLITGWQKELYGAIKVDSSPELTVARILDADPVVMLWVRNPRGQLWIPTLVGRHSPDFFVAVTNGGFVLIEVKRRRDLEDVQSEARRRARAAAKWCEEVSRGSDRPWAYVLLADDAVDRCSSLRDLQSNAWPA